MLSPSWPSPADLRRPVPPSVRRRVAAAQRRALRRAVTLGAGVLTGLLLADLALNLAAREPGAVALAPFELLAAGLVAGVMLTARRAIVPAEPLAVLILLVAVATALLGIAVMPGGRLLGAAQLAILLVGVGLFLPWGRGWHTAALVLSVAMAAIVVLGPLDGRMSDADRVNLLAGVVMAAITSVVGQALWQGRLSRMLEQQFELRHLSRYAQRQEAHVTALNRELNHVARRDALTGVGNRLALEEAIAHLLDQGDRLRPVRFAIALFDIDEFKAYNDEHGHLAGDAALGHLGEILRRATRGGDHAFRYGGEEFLLLISDVDLTGAIAVAERVRESVDTVSPAGLPPFTVSGGVALCDPADGRDPEPLLRRADTALYLAKRAGRNRIAADDLSVAMQRQELPSAG